MMVLASCSYCTGLSHSMHTGRVIIIHGACGPRCIHLDYSMQNRCHLAMVEALRRIENDESILSVSIDQAWKPSTQCHKNLLPTNITILILPSLPAL